MNINSTCLHELGSVLKPLIMALGLDVGKVSMTGTYDVTNLKIDFEDRCSTAQILWKSSSKGIAKVGLCLKKKISQYF